MISRVLISVLCIVSSVFVSAQNQKSKNAQALFSVNGKPVSTDEFLYLYRKNHQNSETDYTRAKIEEYLTLYINFKLKVEEARKRGMDTTAAFQKEFNQYREELRKPYLPDADLTEKLVRLTYARMKEEVRASHLLVSLQPDASPDDTLQAYARITTLRNRVLTGEDFGRLAAAASDDPSAKVNKGDLGYFTALQMVYPFESAAYSTSVGEVSQPVRTRFGYHIIYVHDRRPARGEVEVSHIMIRTGEARSEAQGKSLIFDVYDQLQAGVKWEELCLQYSDDPGSKEQGGKLRPFGVGAMNSVPEFERVAFELEKPGDYSDPFQTQYGWHIVRLERKIPLPTYEEVSASLKNRVTRDERTQLSKQALQQKLRADYGFSENETVKRQLEQKADSSLQKGRWNTEGLRSLNEQVLFTLHGQKYVVRDFIAYVKLRQRSTTLSPDKYFEQLYNNFIDASILELTEQKISSENPEYRYLLNEYYEGILLFEIMEKEVWNKASADSIGQYRFYEGRKQQYKAGERVKAVFYSAKTKEFIEPLKGLLEEDNDSKINAFVTQNRVRAESGFYKKEDKAILQTIPWAKGIYTAENNGMYYLAWLKEVLPPGVMSFEEARPAVVSDYQGELEKRWIEQLRKKYRVKVNKKGKDYVLQQLQKA